jgi:hypothetical protein
MQIITSCASRRGAISHVCGALLKGFVEFEVVQAATCAFIWISKSIHCILLSFQMLDDLSEREFLFAAPAIFELVPQFVCDLRSVITLPLCGCGDYIADQQIIAVCICKVGATLRNLTAPALPPAWLPAPRTSDI